MVKRAVSPKAMGLAKKTTSVSPARAVRSATPPVPVTLCRTNFAPASKITESSVARRATSVVVTLPSNDVESQSKCDTSIFWCIRS